MAKGVVFEDMDGNQSQDMYAGEMGLAGWTIELRWNGQLVTSATSDADGMFEFDNLGNTGDSQYTMCVQLQGGYAATLPANGSNCYSFPFNSSFTNWFVGNFGMQLPQ
ncbi:MAG: SdrD B-like domain-containing protein [Gemmatimonadales bacterium]